MTKQDFEKIAACIRALSYTFEGFDTLTVKQRHTVAVRFAFMLTTNNPRFDVDRFMRACEVTA